MAKLFLSYSRKDAIRASRLAEWLEREGHDVWRDDDDISGGASFSSEIEAALKDCDAVLVLWSQSSHDSAWVRDEAAVGRDAHKLIPFSLDQSEAPLGFRQFQTIDLSKWKRGDPPKAAQIRQAIARHSPADPATPADVGHPAGNDSQAKRRPLAIAIAGLLLAAVAGVTGYFVLGGAKPGATTIAIVGDSAGSAGSDLAGTISAEMAPVLAARAEDATILDPAPGKGEAPDFQLNVVIASNRPDAAGRLSLTSRHERGVVWSRNWTSAEAPGVALKQQMSFLGSIAILCALNGNEGGLSNRDGALGFYVEACARNHDPQTVVSVDEFINLLTKVVQRAPDFADGWGDLALNYSAQIVERLINQEAASIDLLSKSRNAIENTRRIEPNSAKAFLAEGLLLGGEAKPTRSIQVIDRAVDADPFDPEIRWYRSKVLMGLGRQADAIADSRKAIELSPPSPPIQSALIFHLMRAGRSNEGLAELRKAEKLWPANPEFVVTRYNYELEYGDPRIARNLLPSLAGLDDERIAIMRRLIDAKVDPNPTIVDPLLAELQDASKKLPRRGRLYLYALGHFHRVDEAFQLLADPRVRSFIPTSGLFVPLYAPVRADPRFMKVAADYGLTGYWRSSGKWPDFCADPALPYDCRVEAAKYK